MSATSYLVSLFTLIYLVLFHLILPYNLDIPSYLNNRLRYCAAWPERDKHSLHFVRGMVGIRRVTIQLFKPPTPTICTSLPAHVPGSSLRLVTSEGSSLQMKPSSDQELCYASRTVPFQPTSLSRSTPSTSFA
jgi:hypothetical protein